MALPPRRTAEGGFGGVKAFVGFIHTVKALGVFSVYFHPTGQY